MSKQFPIFANANEACENDGFCMRFDSESIIIAPGYKIYQTNEYMFDRHNEIRYSKKYPSRKPIKMKWNEIALCWLLIDKDIRIKEIKRENSI